MDDSLFLSLLALGEKKFHEIRLEAFVWAELFVLFDDFLEVIGFEYRYRAATLEVVLKDWILSVCGVHTPLKIFATSLCKPALCLAIAYPFG